MPKTQRWREIAGAFAEDSLLAVRTRLETLADEPEVQQAMTFLIALPIASRSSDPVASLGETFGILLVGEPSVETLRDAAQSWISGDEAGARTAAVQAVAAYLQGRPEAGGLFGEDPWQVWRELDGSPFCELGRLFFAFLLERVMVESLEAQGSMLDAVPEPSPPTPSPKTSHLGEGALPEPPPPVPSSKTTHRREGDMPEPPSPYPLPPPGQEEGGALASFPPSNTRHSTLRSIPGPAPPTPSTNHNGEGAVSLHAFETSKIVQPFVARWYNAQVKGRVPDAGNVRWFLAHSFGKLDLEIERELGGNPVVRSRSAHRQEPLEGIG